jgi:hypothetical protein
VTRRPDMVNTPVPSATRDAWLSGGRATGASYALVHTVSCWRTFRVVRAGQAWTL